MLRCRGGGEPVRLRSCSRCSRISSCAGSSACSSPLASTIRGGHPHRASPDPGPLVQMVRSLGASHIRSDGGFELINPNDAYPPLTQVIHRYVPQWAAFGAIYGITAAAGAVAEVLQPAPARPPLRPDRMADHALRHDVPPTSDRGGADQARAGARPLGPVSPVAGGTSILSRGRTARRRDRLWRPGD